jgi:asparagine synthase (glutamine-hydrolysing)
MSIQFGRWNFEGQPPDADYIDKVRATLAPYGPDGNQSYAHGGLTILYFAFHTTTESQREIQPYISASGTAITWDGRLDNRAELISELRHATTCNSTDVTIVSVAYEQWGAKCFAKLIGDWALSIWDPNTYSLLLAKDPIGTRHLYYSVETDHITWSTVLDPLALLAGKTFALNEEYIAGWLSAYPAPDLTPYHGIRSVPPSSFVLLQRGKHTIRKYWDFDPDNKIRYRTDAEYEEHFRTALATAVRRKLRSDRPILAELSGGMDSSSIVCMADIVTARGQAECPRLDTLSWYDDSYDRVEYDSNELHWITKVENKRGRSGYHINLHELDSKGNISKTPFHLKFDSDSFAAIPISNVGVSALFKEYAAYMKSTGHRVVLSGIGGGEVTGDGVPTPKPELQDLLVRARFVTLTRQLNAWAEKMRRSRLALLWEAARGFLPIAGADVPEIMRPAPWFSTPFIHQIQSAIRSYCPRVKLFGPLPSFQANVRGLDTNRRVMAYFGVNREMLRDLRYPYLDRDLLAFTYAIPRQQIVRVGQRRSLMKRALVGIVPNELLNRKRIGFVPKGPLKGASTEWPYFDEIGQHIVRSSIGIIDPNRFLTALQQAESNEEVSIAGLRRTLTLVAWLRHLAIQGVLTDWVSTKRPCHASSLGTKEVQVPTKPKTSA